MRTIDLTPYATRLDERDSAGQLTGKKLDFQVGKSLVELLFYGQHAPREVVRRANLADRVEQAVEDGAATFAFEDEEWRWITEALELAKPTGRQFAEFISRVLDATPLPRKREIAPSRTPMPAFAPRSDAATPYGTLHPEPTEREG